MRLLCGKLHSLFLAHLSICLFIYVKSMPMPVALQLALFTEASIGLHKQESPESKLCWQKVHSIVTLRILQAERDRV